MIFDYDLMFVDDANGTQKNVSTGVLGSYLDLRAKNQGKGFPIFVAIAFTSDTTATADPDIQFSLETADNSSFTDSKTIPLSFKTPMKKADLVAGVVLSDTLPRQNLERYVRLKIGVDSPITCIGIKAGLVFDAPLA